MMKRPGCAVLGCAASFALGLPSGALAGEQSRGFVEFTPMLPVADIHRSVSFYATHFGFKPVDGLGYGDHIALLRRGDVSLYVVLDSEPTSDKPNMSI